jgi:glycosyltransferase involved in cell wall biosynthesis
MTLANSGSDIGSRRVEGLRMTALKDHHAMQPLVSVLTPSYNQARWLADNLRSVAKQSHPAIEHVVMDGGSTDDSLEILRLASPAVVWESAPDKGQSDAINKAFSKSTGEIIGWLNSDDAYFSRDVVARAVKVFVDHPEVGVVYGHAALVNAEGTLLHVIWAPSFARALLRAYNLICQPTVFIRRSVIGRPNLVDPDFDYCMDRELWLHLARRTRFHRLDRILAIDRHHLQRKSLTRLDLAAHDRVLIAQRYRVPALASNPVLLKSMNIGIRLAGLSKVREAARGSDVLTLDVTSAPAIVVRQVAQLRRWMPSGDR